MAIERDFITPAGMTVVDTANVVGNTTSTDFLSDTVRSNAAPSLRLDFAKTKTIDSRVKFFRNSIATYEDEKGIIRTVGVNVPRFNHANGVCEGLLIEDTKINLWRNNVFDYGNAAATAGTAIGPDGQPAIKYVVPRGRFHTYEGWGGGGGNFTASLTNGVTTDYTFTGYFGPSTGTIPLRADIVIAASNTTPGQTSYCECVIDGNTGTVESAYAMSPFTTLTGPTVTRHVNGMWKLRWTVRHTADSSQKNIIGTGGQIRSTGGVTSFTGDGESGIQIACCQFEQGTEPSSYIPTSTSSAARASEVALLDGAAFADVYNPNQAALFIEGREYTNTTSRGLFTVSDGTANNVAYHGYLSVNQVGAEVINNGVFTASGFGAKTSGATFRFSQSYNGSNTVCYHNGAVLYNSTNAFTNIPKNVDRLIIGNDRFSNGYLISGSINGTIKRFYLYKTPLTPQQQALLTAG